MTPRRTLAAVATLAVLVSGCSGSTSSRPTSTAVLTIVSPTPNQVTGPDVTIKLNLVGAAVVPATIITGKLRGDQGHIHVSIDGQLVSMAYSTTQDLHGLKPGNHALQAEFVAIDHRPFAKRVIAAPVLFVVQASGPTTTAGS